MVRTLRVAPPLTATRLKVKDQPETRSRDGAHFQFVEAEHTLRLFITVTHDLA